MIPLLCSLLTKTAVSLLVLLVALLCALPQPWPAASLWHSLSIGTSVSCMAAEERAGRRSCVLRWRTSGAALQSGALSEHGVPVCLLHIQPPPLHGSLSVAVISALGGAVRVIVHQCQCSAACSRWQLLSVQLRVRTAEVNRSPVYNGMPSNPNLGRLRTGRWKAGTPPP